MYQENCHVSGHGEDDDKLNNSPANSPSREPNLVLLTSYSRNLHKLILINVICITPAVCPHLANVAQPRADGFATAVDDKNSKKPTTIW